MYDDNEEIEEEGLKTDNDEELDIPEGMTDFGLDEEDPDDKYH